MFAILRLVMILKTAVAAPYLILIHRRASATMPASIHRSAEPLIRGSDLLLSLLVLDNRMFKKENMRIGWE